MVLPNEKRNRGILEKGLSMKTCTKCKIEKELVEFGKNNGSKDGLQSWCKSCQKSYVSRKKNKSPGKTTIKYRKCKSLIMPVNPIPIKLTSMDGFGGYYRFDIDKFNQQKEFAKLHGQKNHMVKRSKRCLQIKSSDLLSMQNFCNLISMSTDAIITFEKTDKTVYVVNLYHPRVLEIMK